MPRSCQLAVPTTRDERSFVMTFLSLSLSLSLSLALSTEVCLYLLTEKKNIKSSCWLTSSFVRDFNLPRILIIEARLP